jgi:4-amino-4-deoxy-L-arabinose transferase-like glycosyltransferase
MIVFIAVLTFVAVKSAKNKYLIYILVPLISIISCTLWGIYSKTVPVSDYKILFEGAKEIVNGAFREGFDKSSYFYFYNYQVGFASYLAAVMLIFGQKLIWFKTLEILYIAGSSILVYLIAKKLLDVRIAAIAAILFSTFIFNVMGSSVINNQHLSGLLMLLGIRLVLINSKRGILAAGIVFSIMNLMRPLGIVIIIAVILKFVYEMIEDKKWLQSISKIAVLLISFYAAVWIINFAYIGSGITPRPVSQNNIPYFKFVIGLGAKNGSLIKNVTIDARRTSVYNDLKDLNFDYDKYNQECLEFIQKRATDFKNTSLFIAKKMRFFMGEKDHQFTFALTKLQQSEPPVRNLTMLGQMQYLLLLLFGFLAVIIKFRAKSEDMNLIYISFLCFVLVYILIEAQTRYRYDAYFFLVIIASEALVFSYDTIVKCIQTHKNPL